MENKNLPELQNPMINMMDGGFPGAPQLIQNLRPLDLPRPSFDQNPVGLFLGNIKIRQIEKMAGRKANIDEATNRSIQANLDSYKRFFTFTGEVYDTLRQYEHNNEMRKIEVQTGHARLELIKQEIEEKKTNIKEKEANIQQINYQTALIAQDVEMAKLEHKMKLKQVREILGED